MRKKRGRGPEADETTARIQREVLGDVQPTDPGGQAVADLLMSPKYAEQLARAEAEGQFSGGPYRRAILFVRSYTDLRPALCDLVGDRDGQGEPPALDQFPPYDVLARDLPYDASLGDRIKRQLHRWCLPDELVLVIVPQAEIEGPRRTRLVG